MPQRELRYGPTFTRDLEALSKKHPDITDTVNNILQSVTPEGSRHIGKRVAGQNDVPVYIARVPIRNMGKRRAGRMIYYRDNSKVMGLLLFTKNTKDFALPAEIKNALAAAGLLGD